MKAKLYQTFTFQLINYFHLNPVILPFHHNELEGTTDKEPSFPGHKINYLSCYLHFRTKEL